MPLLTATHGDTWEEEFPITDDDGTALDITGYSFTFSAKYRAGDADSAAVIQLQSGSSAVAITDAAGGILRVTIASTGWGRLTGAGPWSLVWALTAVVTGGKVKTVASGSMLVEKAA